MLEDDGKWQCEAENTKGYIENGRPIQLVVLGTYKTYFINPIHVYRRNFSFSDICIEEYVLYSNRNKIEISRKCVFGTFIYVINFRTRLPIFSYKLKSTK